MESECSEDPHKLQDGRRVEEGKASAPTVIPGAMSVSIMRPLASRLRSTARTGPARARGGHLGSLRGGGACLSLPEPREGDQGPMKLGEAAWPALGESRAAPQEARGGSPAAVAEPVNVNDGAERKVRLEEFLSGMATQVTEDPPFRESTGGLHCVGEGSTQRIVRTAQGKDTWDALEPWEERAVAAEERTDVGGGRGAAEDLTKALSGRAGRREPVKAPQTPGAGREGAAGGKERHEGGAARLGRLAAPDEVTLVESRAEMRGERRRDRSDRATLQQVRPTLHRPGA